MIADDISLRDRQGPTRHREQRLGDISGIPAENFRRNARWGSPIANGNYIWCIPLMIQRCPTDFGVKLIRGSPVVSANLKN